MKVRPRTISEIGFCLLAAVMLIAPICSSQITISTGSIQGTVKDSIGAVVSGAKVTITDRSTRLAIRVTTSSAGVYTSGPLVPGTYRVEITSPGFKTLTTTTTVLVDNSTTLNAKLEVGHASETIEVEAANAQVNTGQATVQGVLNESQIENLPINGRNFLDLAQLEPGVQIQDGENFDPTKAGYSSISFGGRFGRTARIEVDGVDVSDETVGTTTEDIPASAIQEFQISQSSLDMSTELTSSGAVNVTTKPGSNAFHGEGFGQFRDSSLAAALPTPPGFKAPFQRSQYGGNFGGAIVKNKLFFFMGGERTQQHTAVPVPISAPFSQYSGTFEDLFREGELLGRFDYNISGNARAFYRFSYFKNLLGATSGFGYSLYDNKDIARQQVVGLNFNTGSFAHQIRFSYLKFQNQMVDATTGNSALPFNNLHAEIFMGSSGLVAGPNLLAPQSTPQSDHELKYDGTKVRGAHVIRYGVSYNHIQGGGFASFFRNGPQIVSAVSSDEVSQAATGPFPGGASNPFNYPADSVTVANGLGFATTNPALGFPAGGLGPDNRILLYLGDTWKIKPNLSVSYGLRYERDTGRTDSQLPAIAGLNALMPGLGNPVSQPNKNFGPQLGFAWDPMKNGKTSIRGGMGLFFENAIWNNVVFDAPPREATGTFLQSFTACNAPGQPVALNTMNGQINNAGSASALAICGPSGSKSFPLIGNALPAILALQAAYQAGWPLNLSAANPAFIGSNVANCTATSTNCFFPPGRPFSNTSLFFPGYRSPRAVQMNIGIERQIRNGMVLSVDYLRNVETHSLLGTDRNETGNTRYFNRTGAMAAIATVEANCANGPTVAATYTGQCANDPATGLSWQMEGAAPRPANISDYASFGLGSSADFGGLSCYAALQHPCAFGGINPLAPPLDFLSPIGRSVYDGLQMKLSENVNNPLSGVQFLNFQIAYSLSRFDNTGGGVGADATVTASSGDQDFLIPALDNQNPNAYFGPSTLDRTNQLSFGGYANLRGGFKVGLMSHFYSPLSTTLTVPNTASGAGEIFRTDFTGDGTTQDPIPGTTIGSFGRSINAGNINNVLANYNNTLAGHPTPAGQTLVSKGLMTSADLVGLGAVAPTVPLAPPNQVNLSWLKAFDLTLGWRYNLKERVTFEPSVGFYNLLNFVNFDLPESMMSGLLTGQPGSINGTNYSGHFVNRVGVGTGVFTLGSPRETEFGLKLAF